MAIERGSVALRLARDSGSVPYAGVNVLCPRRWEFTFSKGCEAPLSLSGFFFLIFRLEINFGFVSSIVEQF